MMAFAPDGWSANGGTETYQNGSNTCQASEAAGPIAVKGARAR